MATARKIGPTLACEITPERVIAARRSDDGASLDSYTARALAGGVVTPHLAEANVSNAEALRQAISDALTTVGSRSHDVIAIVPDAAVRVALLEFDTLPERKAEADGVIRFRLKKALPFDVEKAHLSYEIIRADGKVRVACAVVLSSVLQEYETIFRDLGFSPGIVLPSSVASLGNVHSADPVMMIKSDAYTTTLAIIGDGQLLLFRTLENTTGSAPVTDQLVEDVHASLVFFEDTYNMRVQTIMLGGQIEIDSLATALEQQTGVRVQTLVSPDLVGTARPNFPPSALAGVVGALLG
ncbi:MAG TPA: hypothetical protein VN577_10455 [Terriglobales bacterium]|nr:hypothetical protein [Terriglobales bacterium]